MLKSHTLHGCVDWNIDIKTINWRGENSHTLHGCVDWNRYTVQSTKGFLPSHPSRVCGLKYPVMLIDDEHIGSHPSRVCGLKSKYPHQYNLSANRHTLHGCVDWNCVALVPFEVSKPSHPSRVCGLKLVTMSIIEITLKSHPSRVCGLKSGRLLDNNRICPSHPSRVCGLKYPNQNTNHQISKSHPSRVCGLKW